MAATGYEPVIYFPQPPVRPGGFLLDMVSPLPDTVRGATDRFPFGVKFLPWGCGTQIQLVAADCDVDFDASRDYASLQSEVTQPAFNLYHAIECSTLSFPDDELMRKLDGTLALRLSQYVAQELVTGAASGGHGFAADATVVDGVFKLADALAVIENALSLSLGNGVGLVHVTPQALTLLASHGVVRSVGDGRYVTHNGHMVVADAGYASLGADLIPDGETAYDGTTWIIGSGPVYFKMSDPELIGALNHETWLRDQNLRQLIQQAYGILVYDPCAVVATKIDVIQDAGDVGDADVMSSVEVGGAGPYVVTASAYAGLAIWNQDQSNEAMVYIRDGDDINDPVVDVIALNADESVRELYDRPVALTSGSMLVQMVGPGSPVGAVRYIA